MARLVAFGEAMVRTMLDADGVLRETPGGAEWNVAVATARIGRAASFASSVPRAPEEWVLIREASLSAGVDLSDLVVADGDAGIGRYSVDPVARTVEYDRADSAFATLDRGAFDWHAILDGARWLVTSGITPLLGDAPRAAWSAALTFAEMEGVLNAFDMNHRPALGPLVALWGDMVARMRQFHVVVTSPETLDGIAAIEGWPSPSGDEDRIDVMQRIREKTLLPHLCCCFKSPAPVSTEVEENSPRARGTTEPGEVERHGAQTRWSAVAHAFGVDDTREVAVRHTPVEPLGGGDAWLAGYLDGLTEFGNLPTSPRLAAIRADRLAALAQSTFGDASEVTRGMLSEAEERSVGPSEAEWRSGGAV